VIELREKQWGTTQKRRDFDAFLSFLAIWLSWPQLTNKRIVVVIVKLIFDGIYRWRLYHQIFNSGDMFPLPPLSRRIWRGPYWMSVQPEEASTHKSANTHARTVFVPFDIFLWPSDPKINGFSGLNVEHFYVLFGDASCSRFWDIVRKKTDRQTDRQTAMKTLPPPLPTAWVTFCNSLFSVVKVKT